MSALLASILFGLISGTCDVSGYLGLHHLLTANMTGNMLLIALDWSSHHPGSDLGRLIAVPVFVGWTGIMRWAAGRLRRRALEALPALLIGMVLLLGIYLLLAVRIGPFHRDAPNTLATGMIAVLAMATLNVIARLWPALSAGTTAMTGNIVRLMVDLAELALGERRQEPQLLSDSGRLAATVLAFAGGCAIGALTYLEAGMWCAVLPLGFALCLTALCLTVSG